MTTPFDPNFDDCTWTDAWTRVPLIQITPGVYENFVVKSWQMEEAAVCDRRVKLIPPLEVRGLITNDGTLWMSDVPQERLMMFNNAAHSSGRILVGGLGLGMYPQYAMPKASSITIIEANPAVRNLVEPIVKVAADAHHVALDVQISEVGSWLSTQSALQYDTIFLDTWETLDASHLPMVNRLRDQAVQHLAANGRVLLWGYVWMLNLFTDACRTILEVPPDERIQQLDRATHQRADVRSMLLPVLVHFEGQIIEDWDAALHWCRDYAVHYTGEN